MDRTIPADFHLPTAAEGVDGFLRMAEVFGECETFAFYGLAYYLPSPQAQARQILAARQVANHLTRNPADTYAVARRIVANQMGFTGSLMSNFRRTADAGRDLLRERGEWPYDDREDA